MNTTELASAIADAENAVHSRPTDYAAYEALGGAYFDAERYAEAKTALERAIELNPGAAPAYEKIGHIHYRIGSPPQEAIQAYEEAISIDPHYIYSYFGLGILYAVKLGQLDREMESLERGLAANPADPFLTANLGTTYTRMGQIEKAVEILEHVVEENPDQLYAHSWLSLLYLHQKRLDEAAASCLREVELKGDDHSAHRLLGYIYDVEGRKDEAVAELERAVEIEPHDYEARGALAKLYRENGNLTAAQDQYNTGSEMAKQEDQEAGLACFFAVYGNVDQALDLLEIGLKKGQVQPSWARIDPEYAFIQDEPRFQALISERK